MTLFEKAKRLGFERGGTQLYGDYSFDALIVLALVSPERAYIFTQTYLRSRRQSDVAEELGNTEKFIYLWLHGYEDDRNPARIRYRLGADELFIFILQLYAEARSVGQDASEMLSGCFTPQVTGGSSFAGTPYHSAIFQALAGTLVGTASYEKLDDAIAESFPWTKQGEALPDRDVPLRQIAWPCFEVPLRHNRWPILAAVLAGGNREELSYMCQAVVLLADDEDAWPEILDLLCRHPDRLGWEGNISRGNLVPLQSVQKRLLEQSPSTRFALLALLAKLPFDWPGLANCSVETRYLAGYPADKRVEACVSEAFKLQAVPE